MRVAPFNGNASSWHSCCGASAWEVHPLESAERLTSSEDTRVSELLLEALTSDGIDVHVGAHADSVSEKDGHRMVHFGGDEVEAQELIVAVGRAPRVHALGSRTSASNPALRER